MNLNTSDLKLACTRIAGISSNFFTNLEVVGLGCLGRVTIREGKVAMFIRGGRGGAPSIRVKQQKESEIQLETMPKKL